MSDLKSIVIERLERGERIDLDEFGIEYVIKDQRTCGACGSHYRRTHGGYGSICYECGEFWSEEEGA